MVPPLTRSASFNISESEDTNLFHQQLGDVLPDHSINASINLNAYYTKKWKK